MCTELSTTFSAIQKKLVWVRYLLGTEPEGMILHNTKITAVYINHNERHDKLPRITSP